MDKYYELNCDEDMGGEVDAVETVEVEVEGKVEVGGRGKGHRLYDMSTRDDEMSQPS